MDKEVTEVMPEVIGQTALESIERATVDMQIATAHKYPRSMDRFRKRTLEMATIDQETAASLIYRRPVGGGKFAEGMSVRMAEIVAASYGNLRVGSRLVEDTPEYVKAQGYAHDLETNVAASTEVIESCLDKHGKPYSARMRVTVAKAALAKARRDATFQVVPKGLCKHAEKEARRVAVGDEKTLKQKIKDIMAWTKTKKIAHKRFFKAIGIQGWGDIGFNELELIIGLQTAIRDGDTSVEEAFPEHEVTQPERLGSDAPEVLPPQEGELINDVGVLIDKVKARDMHEAAEEAQVDVGKPLTELTQDELTRYKEALEKRVG